MSQIFRLPGLKLTEGCINNDIQLFRVGTFYHSDYGKFEINRELLLSMAKNFDNNVRGVDLAIDYKHDSEDVAAGWIKKVYLNPDCDELWATVEWTPSGSKVLAEKEFRYISPEFVFDYQDNETLKKFGPTLLGAGLTNRPTIKKMEPVVLSEATPMTEREKLNAEQQARSKKYGIEITQDGSLTPPAGQPTDEASYADPVNFKYPMADAGQASNARVRFKQFGDNYKSDKSKSVIHDRIVSAELKFGLTPDFTPGDKLDELLSTELKDKLKKLKGIKAMDLSTVDLEKMSPEEIKALAKDLMQKLADLQTQYDTSQNLCSEMKKEKAIADKKATFSLMLASGKACKAQEQAFLSGDMQKFAEAAQPVRLTESGNSSSGVTTEVHNDPQDEILKIARLKLNEKSVKTLDEGIREALKEKPELINKIYG